MVTTETALAELFGEFATYGSLFSTVVVGFQEQLLFVYSQALLIFGDPLWFRDLLLGFLTMVR